MINYCLAIYKKYKEQILYLFFGGLTTLINIVVFQVSAVILDNSGFEPFELILKIDSAFISNLIAWTVAVIFAYFANKIWVFESKVTGTAAKITEALSFFWARVLSLLLDLAVVYMLFTIIGFNRLGVKIFSNVLVIIFNYFASKFFIFKKNRESKEGNGNAGL